jgi:hypothetical protein
LESQRVRCLTEGYLRGWLPFKYNTQTSRLREEIILDYIQDERLYSLLQNKLLIETSLRSSMENRTKDTIKPIFDVSKHMIGLKLPSALPKDKIEENKTAIGLSKAEIDEWKNIFASVNISKKTNDK